MKIYKVIVKNCYSHPLFLAVNRLSEVEDLYRKIYPQGSEIISIELVTDDVIMREAL